MLRPLERIRSGNLDACADKNFWKLVLADDGVHSLTCIIHMCTCTSTYVQPCVQHRGPRVSQQRTPSSKFPRKFVATYYSFGSPLYTKPYETFPLIRRMPPRFTIFRADANGSLLYTYNTFFLAGDPTKPDIPIFSSPGTTRSPGLTLGLKHPAILLMWDVTPSI